MASRCTPSGAGVACSFLGPVSTPALSWAIMKCLGIQVGLPSWCAVLQSLFGGHTAQCWLHLALPLQPICWPALFICAVKCCVWGVIFCPACLFYSQVLCAGCQTDWLGILGPVAWRSHLTQVCAGCQTDWESLVQLLGEVISLTLTLIFRVSVKCWLIRRLCKVHWGFTGVDLQELQLHYLNLLSLSCAFSLPFLVPWQWALICITIRWTLLLLGFCVSWLSWLFSQRLVTYTKCVSLSVHKVCQLVSTQSVLSVHKVCWLVSTQSVLSVHKVCWLVSTQSVLTCQYTECLVSTQSVLTCQSWASLGELNSCKFLV